MPDKDATTAPAPIPPAPPSGLWSTEFWGTLAVALAGIAAAFGLIPAGDVDNLTTQLKTVAGAAIGLAAAIVPLWRYIQSRTTVKVGQVQAAAIATAKVPVTLEVAKS
jgi:hypothetical protein